MMGWIRHRKAISPVIATVLVIAITVGMVALISTLVLIYVQGDPQLIIDNVDFGGTSSVTVTVKNIGTAPGVVRQLHIRSGNMTFVGNETVISQITLQDNNSDIIDTSARIAISFTLPADLQFVSGQSYVFTLAFTTEGSSSIILSEPRDFVFV